MTAESPAAGRAADEPGLSAISEEEWARFAAGSAGPGWPQARGQRWWGVAAGLVFVVLLVAVVADQARALS
ncbi:hypothetical protein [Streptomyces albus]|uniref:hypothetical protein n=1 Tax=Streptomyces albus TaxID=1888 RepID=UPI000AF11D08|nr:hypothetical protein [Streptomyces albus]